MIPTELLNHHDVLMTLNSLRLDCLRDVTDNITSSIKYIGSEPRNSCKYDHKIHTIYETQVCGIVKGIGSDL